jgi:hypothetical protein
MIIKKIWVKNMKTIKIVIGISIILISIGAVCATDINDWNLPNNFNKESEFWASNGDIGLSINEYKDSDYDYFFTNSSDYIVVTSDNITNYTDTTSNQVGCDEIIEHDGEKLLIECYSTNSDELEKCYDFLLEFNKLNNVEPIEV